MMRVDVVARDRRLDRRFAHRRDGGLESAHERNEERLVGGALDELHERRGTRPLLRAVMPGLLPGCRRGPWPPSRAWRGAYAARGRLDHGRRW